MATKKSLATASSVSTMLRSNSIVVEVDGALRRISLENMINAADLGALLPYTEDTCSYGIEFDTTVSSPSCTRIGSKDLHKSLPIQSRMRGCLLDDDGNVVEYLDPQDWTGNVRDGSRGQVMVEIPLHYRKCETDGTKRRVRISELPLPGYDAVPRVYVSAYQATVQRSTLKLCSVVNSTTDYRGGDNTADYDSADNSLLGVPASNISRTNFRTYARKRKTSSTEWNCMTYDAQKTIYWLFAVEYATLNTQAAYNATPTSEGYRQGGLGDGVTTLNDAKWMAFNKQSPFVPCGLTDTLGNRTGVVEMAMPALYDSSTPKVSVPRYRGLENPFGHIWQWTDGINVRVSADTANGDGLSKVFVCHDPAKFSDDGYDGYSHVGNEDRTAGGYVKEIIFGEGGEIMPKAVGGSSTTYFCDSHYTSIPTSGEVLRGVRFGGHARDGSHAGFVYAHTFITPSNASTTIGSRLCFVPKA